MERVFDLKGSSVNRETSYEDRTLKDINLQKMLMTKEISIQLAREDRVQLID